MGDPNNPKNYFGTVHKAEFNYKGDPSKIRGTMAQEVKDDLRASHFKVGFDQKNSENARPPSEKINRPVTN